MIQLGLISSLSGPAGRREVEGRVKRVTHEGKVSPHHRG